MPELPEVETIRRELESTIVGLCIAEVQITDSTLCSGRRAPATLPGAGPAWRGVRGCRIKGVERWGKFLALRLDSGKTLLISLRMTGQLLWGEPRPGARARISFEGRRETLNFMDARRLGEMRILGHAEAEAFRSGLGPDAWEALDGPGLCRALRRRRASRIHSALLNQRVVAGVGNIYAAEALFRARIRPSRRVGRLSAGEVRSLADGLRESLSQGLRHEGCTVRSFRDIFERPGRAQNHLAVYGRSGRPCPSCRSPLASTRITGRGVAYCRRCQA